MPRLDRHMSAHTGIPRKGVRLMLAQARVTVDGVVARDIGQLIGQFSQVLLDGIPTQNNAPRYLMLNKPQGVVCATKDKHHRTVIDLLDQPLREQLHIAGRLDFNSTGLVLLTNDGKWSRRLSAPTSGLIKRYRVTTEQSITRDQIEAFERGMHFEYEGIITRPAQLTTLGDRVAEVGLIEGRYHQIKRMFGRFGNRVLSIHRFAVGDYELGDLGTGDCRDIARHSPS
jgi:16S rRNA pseudouridine516 synthase